MIRTSPELVGQTHLCLFFIALDFSGIEEESLPPPTVKKAGSQEVGIWEEVGIDELIGFRKLY